MRIKKNIRILFKGFTYLFKIEKTYAILHFTTSVLSPLRPYINIYMTALIINAIEMKFSITRIMSFALITVLLNFLFDLILSSLNRKKSIRLEQFYKNEQMFFAEHAMAMQYKFLEDANIYSLKERVKSESQSGYNLFYLNVFSGQLISSVSSIFGAITLGVELFVRSNVSIFFKVSLITMMIFVIWVNYYITKISNKKNIDMFNALVSYNTTFNFYSDYNENYTAGKDVRIYNMGDEIAERLKNMNSCAGETIFKTKKSIIKYVVFQIFTAEILNVLVYAFVIMVCLQGNVGIGDITKYASALILLVSGFSSLIKNYQSLINNNNYLEKYFSYFEIPEEVEMKQKYENEGSQVDYTIEFKNVSFSYPNTNYFALKNISFVISSGEKVAIVGKNGSGKTTMIKLLCRLYNPDEGEIYVNGQNIRDINFNDYIKILSVVFQDYKLFAFSLKQNIVLAE